MTPLSKEGEEGGGGGGERGRGRGKGRQLFGHDLLSTIEKAKIYPINCINYVKIA